MSTSSPSAAASSSPANLPPLRFISFATLEGAEPPVLRIKTDEDVDAWKLTTGYRDFGLFLQRLAAAVVGHSLPYADPGPDQAVSAVVGVLDVLDGWVDEIPPLATPQRFGNLAFRTWGRRLEEEAGSLLKRLLPAGLERAVPFIEPYFVTAFGSFIRMDYGTGHETSFALFLLSLTLLRFLAPEPRVERQIVLTVFLRYLRLCWRLQDVYKLEPAGSHGVWGLDDYHFLTYVFGSAQLRDQREIPVDAVLRPPLPPTNLYFMSITRIREVKSGPFHEHSSQLFSIATGVQYWTKVHTGLFKMYEAEVLGKRVVVQHIPLGGLLEWDSPRTQSTAAAYTPAPFGSPYGASVPTPPMPTSYPSAATRAPTSFPTTVGHAAHSGPLRRPGVVSGSPFQPARMPLGPTASNTYRPMTRPGVMPATLAPPPPPPPSHASAREHRES